MASTRFAGASRDRRNDSFVRVVEAAMRTRLGEDADEVVKVPVNLESTSQYWVP